MANTPAKPRATGGQKAKASRIRRALARGEPMSAADQVWLAEYEENFGRAPGPGEPAVIDVGPVPAPAGNTDEGSSRSGRKVKFELEEAAEAHGTGAAAPTAASMAVAALTAREEGRRIDALTTNALAIMESACAQFHKMNEQLLTIVTTYQEHHLDFLDSVRAHHMARTKAEADAFLAEAEAEQAGDPAKQLLLMALMKQFGVAVPDGADPAALFGAAARQAAGKTPPRNGANAHRKSR